MLSYLILSYLMFLLFSPHFVSWRISCTFIQRPNVSYSHIVFPDEEPFICLRLANGRYCWICITWNRYWSEFVVWIHKYRSDKPLSSHKNNKSKFHFDIQKTTVFHVLKDELTSFSRKVAHYTFRYETITEYQLQKKMSTGGANSWPPRSPDLSPWIIFF
jgi:hypothetical protein